MTKPSLVRELIKSSRPISWVNTAYPFAAGYFIISGVVDWRLIVGTLYFLIPYNLLMYGINDVFDYESDLHNPRKGGVEGSVLDRRLHRWTIWLAVLTNLPFVIILFWAGSMVAALVLLAVLFMVVAYSAPGLRFKERPILDSITSASHFVGPLVYALALVGFPASAWPYTLAFFAWAMASHAFGAVQDIRADRAGKIHSVATVLGARNTVWIALGLYLVASGILALANPAYGVVAAAGLLYVANTWPYRHLTDAQCEQAHAGWQRFIWLNWVAGAIVTMVLIAHVIRTA